jgi:hypothetical protein
MPPFRYAIDGHGFADDAIFAIIFATLLSSIFIAAYFAATIIFAATLLRRFDSVFTLLR